VTNARALAGVILIGLGVGVAFGAQPADSGPARSAPSDSATPSPDGLVGRPNEPASAKRLLERRIEDLQRRERTLRDALARIERGEAPAGVLSAIEDEPRRGSRGGEFRRRAADDAGPGGPDEPSLDREGPDWAPRALSPEQRERSIAFLRQHLPTLAARFNALQERNAAFADRMLSRMTPGIREAQSAERDDPELFELRLDEMRNGLSIMDATKKARDLASSADGSDADRRAAEAELREALERQFDIRSRVQSREIERLERRLARLREDLAEKRGRRDSFIDGVIEQVRRAPPRPAGGPDGPPR